MDGFPCLMNGWLSLMACLYLTSDHDTYIHVMLMQVRSLDPAATDNVPRAGLDDVCGCGLVFMVDAL